MLLALVACVTPAGSDASRPGHDSPRPTDTDDRPYWDGDYAGYGPSLGLPDGSVALLGDYGEYLRTAVVDLDQDGTEDYVLWRSYADDVGYSETDITVFTGGPTGDVSAGAWDHQQGGLYGVPVVVPDADGDGHDDVLIDGSGVFSGAQLTGADPLTGADAIGPDGAWPDEILGDVNGDGRSDRASWLVFGGEAYRDSGGPLTATITVWTAWPADPGTWYDYATTMDEFGTYTTTLDDFAYTSDRDGDGLKDIWGNPGDGRWKLYASSGLVDEVVDVLQVVEGADGGCNAGDMDGDTVDDLVVAAAGGITAVLATDGDVDAATLPAVFPSSGTFDRAERVADIDGDGILDLVAWVTGGTRTGWVRVSGALVLTGGVVDVDAPDWLVETEDWLPEFDPDRRAIWIDDAIPGKTIYRHSRVPLGGNPGVVDFHHARVSFNPNADVLGAGDVAVRWWGDNLVVLARQAPFGVAVVPLDSMVEDGPLLTNWQTWATEGAVGLLPDLDHDGDPEVLLEAGGRVSRWSIDALEGAGAELSIVEALATTDLVTWDGGALCDLTGDGIDDPLSSVGPIDGASVLDTTEGIRLLAELADLGGCVGDLDGDGVGDLATVQGAPVGRIYSGAEAANGRATAIFTYPTGAWPGIASPVDVDGDGVDEIPWADGERAGWLAEWPVERPTRTDLRLGVIGGTAIARLWAWPATLPEVLGVTGAEGAPTSAPIQVSFYQADAPWQWWSEWDRRIYTGGTDLLLLQPVAGDPEIIAIGTYEYTNLWRTRRMLSMVRTGI